MKLKTIILTLLLALAGGIVSAQSTSGLAPLSLDYAGFDFQVPAGAIVTKDAKMNITYDNMVFGMNLTNQVVRGSNQKRAYELCEGYAKKFELKGARVEKVTVGGAKGARAVGMLDDDKMEVMILILPTNDNELTAVLMYDPRNRQVANDVVASMKH